MDTQEIHDHVAGLTSGEYLDYDTYYTGTEDTLFSEEDDVTPITRTFAVDEDQLAQLVEHQLKIDAVNSAIEDVAALAEKVSNRLELARTDYNKRLPKEVYLRGINKMVELVGSKKLGKQGKLQNLVAERNRMINQRDAGMTSDRSALWAAWYAIADHEAWFTQYQEADGKPGWDAEDYDNQAHLTDDAATVECIGDEHVMEMIRGEGLVWQDQKPVKENPYLPRDSWNYGTQKKMEAKAVQAEALKQEDDALFAQYEEEDQAFIQQFVGE